MFMSVYLIFYVIAGSFRVSLFLDLGCPIYLETGWRGAFGTFMISRPMKTMIGEDLAYGIFQLGFRQFRLGFG